MASNRGIVYIGPGKVEVQGINYPKFVSPNGKEIDHGVIVRILSTNICGSDQHMVRGRTTAPPGLVLGHEITGEVIEKGHDVEFLEIGDLVSVPFNVACGRCRNCREQKTGICLNVNPARPGGAYGYVDMGGWVGGQAEFVMVPYVESLAVLISAPCIWMIITRSPVERPPIAYGLTELVKVVALLRSLILDIVTAVSPALAGLVKALYRFIITEEPLLL